MVTSLPRLVVAAPASGSGKTAVVTGLLAALRARGLAVSGHKVGPDYIDPGYHALAAGRPPRNLDPVLVGEERVGPLLLHGARGCELAVVEGVLGLFDGRGGTDTGSTAHVARLIGAPVLLVVDAAAASRSLAALVHGFATFDPGVRLAGLVLNRIGSAGHEEAVRAALAPLGIPVLGALPRTPEVAVSSRHLGLVPAPEQRGNAERAVARLGELVARHLDLDALLALARSAPPLAGAAWDPTVELRAAGGAAGGAAAGPPATVALAAGAAFTFSYTEHAELLAAAGLQVVPLDPLRAEELPAGVAGLVLGGGFPEVHAAELSANAPLCTAVADFAAAGGAVYAECAGLLYLAESLDGVPMCGVLPAQARMTDRLTLGYRDALGLGGLGAGLAVTGHEFHRTRVDPPAGRAPAWRIGGQPEGFVVGRVQASYLHVHWAGRPELAARFAAAVRTREGAVR
ncbi:MAG: cobyrinate a,c-diamide synthase [Mycobacteriales bacterium]